MDSRFSTPGMISNDLSSNILLLFFFFLSFYSQIFPSTPLTHLVKELTALGHLAFPDQRLINWFLLHYQVLHFPLALLFLLLLCLVLLPS